MENVCGNCSTKHLDAWYGANAHVVQLYRSLPRNTQHPKTIPQVFCVHMGKEHECMFYIHQFPCVVPSCLLLTLVCLAAGPTSMRSAVLRFGFIQSNVKCMYERLDHSNLRGRICLLRARGGSISRNVRRTVSGVSCGIHGDGAFRPTMSSNCLLLVIILR
jgi:hypothetical protein